MKTTKKCFLIALTTVFSLLQQTGFANLHNGGYYNYDDCYDCYNYDTCPPPYGYDNSPPYGYDNRAPYGFDNRAPYGYDSCVPCNSPCAPCAPCPPSHCCGKFTIGGSYLYWRTCTEGICIANLDNRRLSVEVDIASTVLADLGLTLGTDLNSHHHKSIHQDYESGFKAEVAFQPANSCLNIGAVWTYFCPPSEKRSFRNSNTLGTIDEDEILRINILTPCTTSGILNSLAGQLNTNLIDLGGDPALIDVSGLRLLNAERVRGEWDLDLQMVDLEFGRDFQCWECLKFRPHADVRYINVEQKLKNFSKGDVVQVTVDATILEDPVVGDIADISTETFARFASSQKLKKNFEGVGPRFGIDADWELGCNFGIYGNVGISLLYGQAEYKDSTRAARLDADEDLGPISSLSGLDVEFADKKKKKEWCARPITDVGFGFFYSQDFCNCQFNITARVGWEQHQFFNQGIVVDSDSHNNDFSTQGLVARLTFTF